MPTNSNDPADVESTEMRGVPDDDRFSGFVIVRLGRSIGGRPSDDLRDLGENLRLAELARFLDALGRPASRPVVISTSPEELLRLEESTRDSPWPPLSSLARYWRIDVRNVPESPQVLADRLSRLPGIEIAYAELVVTDPSVIPNTDPLAARQGYLDAAPLGIDARWAWTRPGGRGQAIAVTDVEQGWRLSHQDLSGTAPQLAYNVNRAGMGAYTGHHGTAVLGVLAADNNALGVIGIAPSVSSLLVVSHFDGMTALHVADAVVAALRTMQAGDVLVLEVQRGAELPTEVDLADLDAIRLAAGRGVVVVEAAGNGATNLDSLVGPSGRQPLRRGQAGFVDSGAIMVGAAMSKVVAGAHHARAAFSNYGTRVDCYGWGEHVATSGYGDLTPTAGPDALYTATFGGTSSATPIVAGAAVLTQSMYLAATGTRMSPGTLRAVLSAPSTGTSQLPSQKQRIGVMPNLRAIGTHVLGLRS